MAFHVRRQIREAVAGFVMNLPTTGANVFQSRIYPLEDAELPALRVYSQDETTETLTISPPPTQSRKVEIKIDAVAKANVDLDDTLDQICKEVEIAMATGIIEPLARNITLTGTTIAMEEAEHPTGVATMTFEIEYMTADNAPDVAL